MHLLSSIHLHAPFKNNYYWIGTVFFSWSILCPALTYKIFPSHRLNPFISSYSDFIFTYTRLLDRTTTMLLRALYGGWFHISIYKKPQQQQQQMCWTVKVSSRSSMCNCVYIKMCDPYVWWVAHRLRHVRNALRVRTPTHLTQPHHRTLDRSIEFVSNFSASSSSKKFARICFFSRGGFFSVWCETFIYEFVVSKQKWSPGIWWSLPPPP